MSTGGEYVIGTLDQGFRSSISIVEWLIGTKPMLTSVFQKPNAKIQGANLASNAPALVRYRRRVTRSGLAGWLDILILVEQVFRIPDAFNFNQSVEVVAIGGSNTFFAGIGL